MGRKVLVAAIAADGARAETAARLEQPVSRLGGGFMAHPSLLAAGRELGYESNDFYFAGRVGAMGAVTAQVAVAALVFFAPERVESAWRRSIDIQPMSEAALLYTRCAGRWAETTYGDDVDWHTIADLADRMVDSLSFANAPLFAGWLSMPDGGSAKSKAQHRLNALREYRMAVHAAAIVAAGITVSDAVRHAAPQHVELFGWSGDFDGDPDDVASRWDEAEATTNRLMGTSLAVLGNDVVDFVERCEVANSHVFPKS